jgi:hypothetical protein
MRNVSDELKQLMGKLHEKAGYPPFATVGARIGVSYATTYNAMRNPNVVSAPMLARIARAMGASEQEATEVARLKLQSTRLRPQRPVEPEKQPQPEVSASPPMVVYVNFQADWFIGLVDAALSEANGKPVENWSELVDAIPDEMRIMLTRGGQK